MIMKFLTTFLLAAAMMPASLTAAPQRFHLESPDGSLSVDVNVTDSITYSVSHDGETLIFPSRISMTLDDGSAYGVNPGRAVCRMVSNDDIIEAMFYKKAEIRDRYSQMTLKFRHFDLVFRAYDEGVAYRFVSGSKVPFKVVSEQAEFRFTEDSGAYVPYVKNFDDSGFDRQFYNSFENTYEHIGLSEWDSRRLAFLPLVVEAADGKKICITEADLLDYPGMYLHNADGSGTLKGVFAGVPDRVEQGGHNMLQGEVKSRKPYIAECEPGEVFTNLPHRRTSPWISVGSGLEKWLGNGGMTGISTVWISRQASITKPINIT